MKIIITEDQVNLLKENVSKNKKLFTKMFGEDLTGKIKLIDSYNDIPEGFKISRSLYNDMDDVGTMYYLTINGVGYVYQDMGRHEWFINENGIPLSLESIQSNLGVDFDIRDLGLRFRDVINTFLKDDINENVDGSEKIKNLLKKVLENQEYEISFEIEMDDFGISFDWDELNTESLVGNYLIKFYIQVGHVMGEGYNAVATINVIIVGIEKDGEDFYYNWVDSDYSEYAWYINDLNYKMQDELLSNFPFKIHPVFYGYDEQRKS